MCLSSGGLWLQDPVVKDNNFIPFFDFNNQLLRMDHQLCIQLGVEYINSHGLNIYLFMLS